jgi:pilus assembly protein Flp/PilA
MKWTNVMLKFFRGIVKSQDGATAVEYGLIVSLLVIVMMAALTNVAGSTANMWNDVSNEVTEASN